ncbi:hypothetical protein [uncultured Desulfovibrio sp.]|nr:hypothetical protein [uncultured Desulfovibrio sp.]
MDDFFSGLFGGGYDASDPPRYDPIPAREEASDYLRSARGMLCGVERDAV